MILGNLCYQQETITIAVTGDSAFQGEQTTHRDYKWIEE